MNWLEKLDRGTSNSARQAGRYLKWELKNEGVGQTVKRREVKEFHLERAKWRYTHKVSEALQHWLLPISQHHTSPQVALLPELQALSLLLSLQCPKFFPTHASHSSSDWLPTQHYCGPGAGSKVNTTEKVSAPPDLTVWWERPDKQTKDR